MTTPETNLNTDKSILFTSDIHGDKKFYDKIVSFSKKRANNSEPISAIILGGDLFPNTMGRKEALESQKTFINTFFKDFLVKMKDLDIAVYAMPGNMDFSITVNLFLTLQREGLMHSLFSNVCTLPNGLKIAGSSFCPPSPFLMKDMEKREYADDSIPEHPVNCVISIDSDVIEIPSQSLLSQGKSLYQELEYLYFKLDEPHILVTHCPPFDTCLDMVNKTLHAGSKAVKQIIKEKKPLLSLHGHIHESPDVSGSSTEKIGSTISVNAGKSGSNVKAALFNEADPQNSIKIIEF